MPYLIRSKGGIIDMRDGVQSDSPMYRLSTNRFTPFETLPRGTSATGDADVEVREVDSLEGQDFDAPVLAKDCDAAPAPKKKAKKKKKAKAPEIAPEIAPEPEPIEG